MIKNGALPSEDLFTKILAAMRSEGINEAEALERTWTLFGLFATKGGRFFQYPLSVSTSIETGKPYHFWLSAFLARKLAKETGSTDIGKRAAWISALGYQMRSNTAGRSPARAFTSAAFGVANNKIRFDIVYSAAGAQYGSRSVDRLDRTRYDLNAGLRALLRDGDSLTPLEENAADLLWERSYGALAYLRWTRIFSPDSAMKTLSSSK